MKTENAPLKLYLLIVSLVALLGMTIAFGFCVHHLLECLLLDYAYFSTSDLIAQLTWLVLFLILFLTHFPYFLKLNKKAE
ncbi:MAG: hypothetical protein LBP53_08220 [Candidatus Peribacteria bacterium]|jgi:hypothetical protein|nr:hypothetical protein [Candidatus Peribacteria bacterium]